MASTCSYFQRGYCRFGDRCRKSHDLTLRQQRATSSSYYAQNDGATHSNYMYNGNATTSHQNEAFGFRVDRDLKVFKNHFSVTLNPATGEKIDGTPKEVISAIMAKLNTAEKEINYLKVKIQNMCGLDNLPCTEHNDFKLNDDYFHCMVCTQLMIKPIVLNCSHTFCEVCIETWCTVKPLCPICRKKIENKSFCLDLDEYLKKMVELGPADIRDDYKKEAVKRMTEGPKRIEQTQEDDNYDATFDHPDFEDYDSDDEFGVFNRASAILE